MPSVAQQVKNKKVFIHDSVVNGVSILSEVQEEDKHEKENSVYVVSEKVGPDDFMPLKMLGSGSFGEVYLVRHISSGELYAMKVLSKSKILG